MRKYPNITSYKAFVDDEDSYANLEGVELMRRDGDLHFSSGNFATVFKAKQDNKH